MSRKNCHVYRIRSFLNDHGNSLTKNKMKDERNYRGIVGILMSTYKSQR